jgi:hypothetical protein
MINQSRHALKRRFGATAMQAWNLAMEVPSRNSCRTSAIRSMTSSADKDNDNALESTAAAGAWRKQQLNKLEKKFTDPTVEVTDEEDLQPMWKAMESRVTRRRSRTEAEMGGKTGRTNVKITDEEIWLEGGLYDAVGDGHGDEGSEGTKN